MNPTGTEARVCADIAARQAKGTAKYGTTVQDNPLGLIQWLQHAYEECLDQAVYLKRAIEQLQGVENKDAQSVYGANIDQQLEGFSWPSKTLWTPLGSQPAKDPHAELRKTWRDGQVWQFKPGRPEDSWWECSGEPAWESHVQYRRHPEDKDAEPAQTADPHAALKAIYRPGMRWRNRSNRIDLRMSSIAGGWSDYDGSESELPGWVPGVVYEIHPDDLPKEHIEDGWITAPANAFSMIKLHAETVQLKLKSGRVLDMAESYDWNWSHPDEVAAYRIIKPAE